MNYNNLNLPQRFKNISLLLRILLEVLKNIMPVENTGSVAFRANGILKRIDPSIPSETLSAVGKVTDFHSEQAPLARCTPSTKDKTVPVLCVDTEPFQAAQAYSCQLSPLHVLQMAEIVFSSLQLVITSQRRNFFYFFYSLSF